MFCLCQIFDLFCCLDSAQRVYFSAHRYPVFDRHGFCHLVELATKQRLVFVSDCQCSLFFRQALCKDLFSGMSAVFLNDRKITLFFCLFGITGIGDRYLLGSRYVQCTFSSTESADMSHVIWIGDDHSHQSLIFDKLLCFTHDAFLLFRPRSFSLCRRTLCFYSTPLRVPAQGLRSSVFQVHPEESF